MEMFKFVRSFFFALFCFASNVTTMMTTMTTMMMTTMTTSDHLGVGWANPPSHANNFQFG
jgi:hypothetical protein